MQCCSRIPVLEDFAALKKEEAARSSRTLVSYHNIKWHHIPDDINLKMV